MIGVDIEDIERFKNKPQTFLDKVFTQNEQLYCLSKSDSEKHFAARFCAKEAVIKALSSYDIHDVYPKDIEVYHLENKCPAVKILKTLDKKISFNLSISHDRTKAIAFVTSQIN